MKYMKFVMPVAFFGLLALTVYTGWFDAEAPQPQYARKGAVYCLILGTGLTYLAWRKP